MHLSSIALVPRTLLTPFKLGLGVKRERQTTIGGGVTHGGRQRTEPFGVGSRSEGAQGALSPTRVSPCFHDSTAEAAKQRRPSLSVPDPHDYITLNQVITEAWGAPRSLSLLGFVIAFFSSLPPPLALALSLSVSLPQSTCPAHSFFYLI